MLLASDNDTNPGTIGDVQVQPRLFELNLRFDTPEGELSRGRKVLRLRQDTQALLTFKGPAQDRSDVAARQEIEFTVSDFLAARHFLEALGYRVEARPNSRLLSHLANSQAASWLGLDLAMAMFHTPRMGLTRVPLGGTA